MIDAPSINFFGWLSPLVVQFLPNTETSQLSTWSLYFLFSFLHIALQSFSSLRFLMHIPSVIWLKKFSLPLFFSPPHLWIKIGKKTMDLDKPKSSRGMDAWTRHAQQYPKFWITRVSDFLTPCAAYYYCMGPIN